MADTVLGTIMVQMAGGGGAGIGPGGMGTAGPGNGVAKGGANKAVEANKLLGEIRKSGAETAKSGANQPKFWTKALKTMGIQMGIAGILKQSQIFTSTLGSLFQILGAFVDVMLAPWIPIIIPGIRKLADQIPKVRKLSQQLFDWISTTGMSWIKKIGSVTKSIFNFLTDDLWDAGWWFQTIKKGILWVYDTAKLWLVRTAHGLYDKLDFWPFAGTKNPFADILASLEEETKKAAANAGTIAEQGGGTAATGGTVGVMPTHSTDYLRNQTPSRQVPDELPIEVTNAGGINGGGPFPTNTLEGTLANLAINRAEEAARELAETMGEFSTTTKVLLAAGAIPLAKVAGMVVHLGTPTFMNPLTKMIEATADLPMKMSMGFMKYGATRTLGAAKLGLGLGKSADEGLGLLDEVISKPRNITWGKSGGLLNRNLNPLAKKTMGGLKNVDDAEYALQFMKNQELQNLNKGPGMVGRLKKLIGMGTEELDMGGRAAEELRNLVPPGSAGRASQQLALQQQRLAQAGAGFDVMPTRGATDVARFNQAKAFSQAPDLGFEGGKSTSKIAKGQTAVAKFQRWLGSGIGRLTRAIATGSKTSIKAVISEGMRLGKTMLLAVKGTPLAGVAAKLAARLVKVIPFAGAAYMGAETTYDLNQIIQSDKAWMGEWQKADAWSKEGGGILASAMGEGGIISAAIFPVGGLIKDVRTGWAKMPGWAGGGAAEGLNEKLVEMKAAQMEGGALSGGKGLDFAARALTGYGGAGASFLPLLGQLIGGAVYEAGALSATGQAFGMIGERKYGDTDFAEASYDKLLQLFEGAKASISIDGFPASIQQGVGLI